MTVLTKPTLHVFSHLEGSWTLDRSISNQGTFKGFARFQMEPNRALLYIEEGTFSPLGGGKSIKGTRSYRYKIEDDLLVVTFADPYRQGLPYVDLSFKIKANQLIANAVHQCPPDTYDHSMIWVSDTRFQTEIAVSGPKKDYLLSTNYQKKLSS